MTVSSIVPVNKYPGDSQNTRFDFDFLVEAESELVVQVIDKYQQKKKLKCGVDYSISGIGNPNGGYIIFPINTNNHVLNSDEQILLTLDLCIKQESEFKNSLYFNFDILEWTFDYIVRILQIMNRKIDRSVKIQEGSDVMPDDMIEDIKQSEGKSLLYLEQTNAAAEQTSANINILNAQMAALNQSFINCMSQIDEAGLNNKANIDMSNIKAEGLNRLTISRIYNSGVLDDRNGYAKVLELKNSSKVTGLDIVKPDNYTVVGNPIITNDGIASGFSTSNYILSPENVFAPTPTDNWEIEAEIPPINNINVHQQILAGSVNSSNWASFQVTVFQGKLVSAINYGSGEVEILHDISANTSYKIQVKFINSQNKFELYLNNVLSASIETDKRMQVSNNARVYVGIHPRVDVQSIPFLSALDLNTIKFKINGSLVYQPCLKIPYTEAKTGAKIVNAEYRDRVNDWYNQSGKGNYYTIDETNQNFTLPLPDLYGLIENNNKIFSSSGLYIDTYFNEETGSWYREYFSDENKTQRVWLEQGGIFNNPSGSYHTIYLLKKMNSNNKYNFSFGDVASSIEKWPTTLIEEFEDRFSIVTNVNIFTWKVEGI